MQFKTHILFGLFVGLILLKYFNPSNYILFFTLIILGSLIPDIDHPKSKVGKWFKFINFLFEHRGFFHSIFPIIILFILSQMYPRFFLPLFIGYASHIIIDMLNYKGIMLFHPITRFKITGFVKTGSITEIIIFISLIILNVYLILNL